MKVVVPEARINLALEETEESFPCFPNYRLDGAFGGGAGQCLPSYPENMSSGAGTESLRVSLKHIRADVL